MERMEKLLHEASLQGNVNMLLMLLQEDPLILDRVTLDRHGDTPLHIASMLGHMDFVNKIITQKPHLAMELDSKKRLPLHIASAKGHIEIVTLLLSAKPETSFARDRDGKNPLHLAAIKGHYDVVKELVQAEPQAARAMVQQETILHLCVKHNQVETVEFLLSNTRIEVSASNTHGETSMDILAQGPRDMKYQQIIRCLTQAAGVDNVNIEMTSFEQHVQDTRTKTWFDNTDQYDKKPHLESDSDNKGNWIKENRKTLMVVASLIATMAFQTGTNPPGGAWQDTILENETPPGHAPHQAGYAIMPSVNLELYNAYLVCNTVGFVSTLSIILLLTSGLSFLNHRVSLWILVVVMWIATTSMSITYLVSIWALAPDTPGPSSTPTTFERVVFGIVGVWVVLMTLLVVGHTIQILRRNMERMEKLLYEASLQGNVNMLLMLLQEDPLILDRVILDRHGDTPLHIASMLGHMDFVKNIITQKPHLAMELDSKKRLPLHIASAKGHIEIVTLLLSAKPETCVVARDRDGMNALHLAAIKGYYEVVKELVQAQPQAARAMVQQETILHLCVKHNQVEVLKLLMESVGDDHEFISTKDANGNTILHLAVADRQIEAVEFLLLNTTIEVNASNTDEETLMDILAQGPRDMKFQQIMWCLTRAAGVNDVNIELSSFEQDPQNSRTKYDYKKPHLKKDSKNKGSWLEEKRSSLMVVASLIATMAFQAGTNPPSEWRLAR
ncbi:hypothetical protein SSX86_021316 [Deinandra increscens subsp. villosa]|uniref:PGG domain-containing protein n=1 Tax=Deinandra increscens subsp. villosa TaxID=3103831 RepID=A0AAP0CPG8_9ASTR